MIKEVIRFVTSDGAVFEELRDAEAHENMYNVTERLRNLIHEDTRLDTSESEELAWRLYRAFDIKVVS